MNLSGAPAPARRPYLDRPAKNRHDRVTLRVATPGNRTTRSTVFSDNDAVMRPTWPVALPALTSRQTRRGRGNRPTAELHSLPHGCVTAYLHYGTTALVHRRTILPPCRRSPASPVAPVAPDRITADGIHSAEPAGYNRNPDIGAPRRLAIALLNGTRKTLSRFKRKRTWALPITIITATAARYLPGRRVTELTNQLLPEPAANAISAAVQRVNDADPTYIAIAVAAITYWVGKERFDRAITELIIDESGYKLSRPPRMRNALTGVVGSVGISL